MRLALRVEGEFWNAYMAWNDPVPVPAHEKAGRA